MIKKITLLLALMAFTVTSWATTTVTWSTSDLSSVAILAMSYDYSTDETISDITATVYSPTSSDYVNLGYNSGLGTAYLRIVQDGTISFAPNSGKLTKIVINCDPEGLSDMDVSHLNLGTEWVWDNTAKKLTWTGDPASSVTLAGDGTSDESYLGNITSIEFTLATMVTWESSQISGISLECTYENPTLSLNSPISGINLSLTKTDEYGNYCKFANNEFWISDDCGEATFASANGEYFTSIVITVSYTNVWYSDVKPSADWTYDGDSETKTFTWHGTPADEVTISGNIDFMVASIEFTLVDAPANPTPAPTSVTWEESDIDFYVNWDNGSSSHATDSKKGITITAAGGDYDYCQFGYSGSGYPNIDVSDAATLTFSTALANFRSITISYDPSEGYNNVSNLGTGWSAENDQIKWEGDASSVVLANNGSGSISLGRITSIVFSFEAAPAPTPTPSGPTITWTERQINHMSIGLYQGSAGDTKTSPVIKNIITTIRRTNATGDYCQFYNEQINIPDNGELTFTSIVGDITQIVITYDGNSYYNIDNLSSGWTDDDVAHTLTWTGTAAASVILSGDLDCIVSSIEFSYTPAAAPRVGEIIYDASYFQYRITGAQTAKVIAQTVIGTIPASVEDGGVTYYITEVDDYAFYNNTTQSGYIYFGENIAKVGAHAFDGCQLLNEISFLYSVLDTIGDEAFKNCKLLGNFTCLTEFPPVIGTNAFSGDGYLNHISVPSGSSTNAYKAAAGWSDYADKIVSYYSNPATIGDQFFYLNQTTVGLYEISSTSPKEAKVLPYNATVNAIYPITREGTLIIPEEVTYLSTGFAVTGIGANAYKDSTRFDVVMFPEAVTSIESGAFLNCTGVENVFFLWDNPTTVTWYDADKGLEFKTAANGGTKIIVPEGRLTEYQAWAPAWAGCMIEGELQNVTATQDPENSVRYYRTFYDSSADYMMPPSVWAHVGYIQNGDFILIPIAFDGQIVPAGTAVVLESENPTYRLIKLAASSVPEYTGRNDLVGTDVDILRSSLGDDADKVYVLNREATIGSDHHVGMGMYRYTGTTLGEHKAYLIYNGDGSGSSNQQGAPARFLFKKEDQTTGMDNVQGDKVQCTKLVRGGQLIIIKGDKQYNAQGQIIK